VTIRHGDIARARKGGIVEGRGAILLEGATGVEEGAPSIIDRGSGVVEVRSAVPVQRAVTTRKQGLVNTRLSTKATITRALLGVVSRTLKAPSVIPGRTAATAISTRAFLGRTSRVFGRFPLQLL
jgi:hypothetical protein